MRLLDRLDAASVASGGGLGQSQRREVRRAGVLAFAVVVDGVDSDRLGLASKPDPALFLAGAETLGVAPGDTTVVGTPSPGSRPAGGRVRPRRRRRPVGHRAELEAAGADLVVADLDALALPGGETLEAPVAGTPPRPGGRRRREGGGDQVLADRPAAARGPPVDPAVRGL